MGSVATVFGTGTCSEPGAATVETLRVEEEEEDVDVL